MINNIEYKKADNYFKQLLAFFMAFSMGRLWF